MSGEETRSDLQAPGRDLRPTPVEALGNGSFASGRPRAQPLDVLFAGGTNALAAALSPLLTRPASLGEVSLARLGQQCILRARAAHEVFGPGGMAGAELDELAATFRSDPGRGGGDGGGGRPEGHDDDGESHVDVGMRETRSG